MRLIDRLSPSRSITELPESPSWLTSTYPENGGESVAHTYRDYATTGYQGNGIVFSVILARMALFSEAEFKFQNLTTGKLYGLDELTPLEHPWPGGTTGELLARMEQDVSLSGNAFVRSAGDGLERLRPDWCDIISTQDLDGRETVLGYQYRRNQGTLEDAEWYDVDQVAHWSPIPDPLAHWRGMSWLTPVVREINADTAMTVHKRVFFDHAATPNMVIKYQQKLGPESISRLLTQWNATHQGPDRAGKTAILDMGADPTVVGHSFQQMDFSKVQAAGENRIAAAGGVPGIVVGLKEGLDAATYSNYRSAQRRFADITIRPLWRSACASLAKLVDVPADSRLWFDTTRIAALQEGEQERALTFKEKAFTASELIRAGYEPDSVAAAVDAGDLTQLQHTGAIPTALYPEGKVQEATK